MNDGYYPLPASAKHTTCRSCAAPVAWIVTGSGARMSLDLGTVEQREGVTMAMTHFATCPQGKGWSDPDARQSYAIRYHGPTGDVTDPEAVALVKQYRARAAQLLLEDDEAWQ